MDVIHWLIGWFISCKPGGWKIRLESASFVLEHWAVEVGNILGVR